MKSIKLIKKLVEQELREIDGGIMDPNMVPFVPHRQPAADPVHEPAEPTEMDHYYSLALRARLAAEELVKALDGPIYDGPYESAFKASAALRDVLNGLEGLGADPTAPERVVAPPEEDQPVGSDAGNMPYGGTTYTGDTV